jgi:putative endonuclease
MYFTYVLVSAKDSKLYIGITDDLNARLRKHNQGGVRSTKHRRPLRMVHSEEFATRAEARIREKFLKSGPGHQFLRNILNSQTRPDRSG